MMHQKDCLKLNYSPEIKIATFKDKVGINPDRYRLEWVSASEGKRFSQVITEFVEQVKKLGPLAKTGDKIEKKKEKAAEGA